MACDTACVGDAGEDVDVRQPRLCGCLQRTVTRWKRRRNWKLVCLGVDPDSNELFRDSVVGDT